MSELNLTLHTSLPTFPNSWYLFGSRRELRGGPKSKEIAGDRVVVYETGAQTLAALHARCCHMGTDLGEGAVVAGNLQCPFHNWCFDADGVCVRIPGSDSIPGFARQRAYPVKCLKDQVFVFRGIAPGFPLPFFESISADDVCASTSFSFELDCPWYMIAANAADLQHFRSSHDRQLTRDPHVSQPHPWAYRIIYPLTIVGHSWSDRLTRLLAGKSVELELTIWGGTLVLVKSTLERAQSFGYVSITPISTRRSVAHVTIFARKIGFPLAGWLLDQLNVGLRKLLIHRFLISDAPRLRGTDISRHSLIEADRQLVDFLDWLHALPH